ncbi:hypothetical protein ACFOU0_09350 [Salinicoccus sesuvii]|uniref:Uncharacterized protein n=1 Tax=Salinicoccus sesuvii TaxID=868281 RepID=A0ABV7N681_9STAP
MELLTWITIGFIMTGCSLLICMKKGMESKLASITIAGEDEKSQREAQLLIWWIVSTTVWGVVSIMLIVLWFNLYFG